MSQAHAVAVEAIPTGIPSGKLGMWLFLVSEVMFFTALIAAYVVLKLVPEQDALLRAIPRLKESLQINVELAAPDQFIPPLPGWEARSPLVAKEGRLAFHHYDFYAQTLAKIERGHRQDLEDSREMLRRGLVDPQRLLASYEAIEPQLYRYPAVDPATFRRGVEEAIREAGLSDRDRSGGGRSAHEER